MTDQRELTPDDTIPSTPNKEVSADLFYHTTLQVSHDYA